MSVLPPPDAILIPAEVAEWLKIKPRQVEKLGIPCIDLGHKTKRYLVRDVIAFLEKKRNEGSRRGTPTRLAQRVTP